MAYAIARRPGGRIFQWPPNRRVYCPSVLPPKIGDAGAGGGAAGGDGAIGADFGAGLVIRLHSSETVGRGATIELESGEICLISVAQSGVLVRSYRKGLFGALFGSFFGPILYKEQVVHKAAKTAMALSLFYPEQEPSLNFRNPILGAFANAVWHCSSAAEASTALNEATEKAPPSS
jgi:hypothetical protein